MKSLISAVSIFILFSFSNLSAATPWQNICPNADVPYCKDIGTGAYNYTGSAVLRKIKLGTIIGVAWRPQGSVIGISPAIPAAGIQEEIHTSPRDSYYYIIVNSGYDPFLRQCREIKAK